MEIKVIRKYTGEHYTIGHMEINGVYFCDTLEPTVRQNLPQGKIHGKTAIPVGKYNVILNYSNRFKRTLPLLENVPYFTGIRIHRGNKPEDTQGCILPGENKEKGKVLNSTHYEKELIARMEKADKVTIEII